MQSAAAFSLLSTQKQTLVYNGRDVGELPAGTYQIEVDEEGIHFSDRTGYRRTAIYLYVQQGGSTRTIEAAPKDLDSALVRDEQASNH